MSCLLFAEMGVKQGPACAPTRLVHSVVSIVTSAAADLLIWTVQAFWTSRERGRYVKHARMSRQLAGHACVS